jgi:hypothetical protein
VCELAARLASSEVSHVALDVLRRSWAMADLLYAAVRNSVVARPKSSAGPAASVRGPRQDNVGAALAGAAAFASAVAVVEPVFHDEAAEEDDDRDEVQEPPVKRRRRSFLLSAAEKITEDALLAKNAAASAKSRYWLRSFVEHRFPETVEDRKLCDRECARVKRLLRDKTKLAKNPKLPRGRKHAATIAGGRIATGAATDTVQYSKRKRARGGGRDPLAKDVRDELFQWFIDTILNVKGRLPASVLIQQAKLLGNDILRFHAFEVENGRASPDAPLPKLPQFNNQWLLRWRKSYGISWRTCNLHYKCSREVLRKRLGIFWCNVLKVRWLHLFLFGPGAFLRFIDCDEKPLWFTSSALQKTLAVRGAAQVSVKENIPATRDRFTAMTRTVLCWA